MLSIRAENMGDAVVLRCVGRIVAGDPTRALRDVEAALHIDLKEAAQIVYDAVWSDPSDPSKTYQNAAQALLTELRKRSGIKKPMLRSRAA